MPNDAEQKTNDVHRVVDDQGYESPVVCPRCGDLMTEPKVPGSVCEPCGRELDRE